MHSQSLPTHGLRYTGTGTIQMHEKRIDLQLQHLEKCTRSLITVGLQYIALLDAWDPAIKAIGLGMYSRPSSAAYRYRTQQASPIYPTSLSLV